MIHFMKQVSIKDLKAGLSAIIAETEAGRSVLVTRHNRPVAVVGPAQPSSVRRGTKVGTSSLRPAVKVNTKGRILAVLAEDRGAR